MKSTVLALILPVLALTACGAAPVEESETSTSDSSEYEEPTIPAPPPGFTPFETLYEPGVRELEVKLLDGTRTSCLILETHDGPLSMQCRGFSEAPPR